MPQDNIDPLFAFIVSGALWGILVFLIVRDWLNSKKEENEQDHTAR